MGMMTAAPKLGFRWSASPGNNKNITGVRILQYSRRFSISTAADRISYPTIKLNEKENLAFSAPELTVKSDKKDTCAYLYLCLDERRGKMYERSSNLLVRPIRLDDSTFINDDDDHQEAELTETISVTDLNNLNIPHAIRCTKIGTKILFGADFKTVGPCGIPLWDETWWFSMTFRPPTSIETKIHNFSKPKCYLRWGVIDGKLYCFDNSPGFGVLDADEEQVLDTPAFIKIRDGVMSRYSVLFLDGSKRILGWEDPKNGIFCFDATKPENGWVDSPLEVGEFGSFFSHDNTRLVIEDNHPKLGDFNLVFAYNPCSKPFVVSPFFISDACDSFLAIPQCIHLPKELCSEYFVGLKESKNERRFYNSECQFVYLGGRKFGLILHKFIGRDVDGDEQSKGIILFMTFKYDVIVSNRRKNCERGLKIETKLLGTHRFRYSPEMKNTFQCYMRGAFPYLYHIYSF